MKRLLWICGILLIAAGGTLAWVFRPQRADILTDAASIHESAEASPLRRVLWQPPTPLPPQINSDRDDYEPRVSADGQTLFFVRGKAGGSADIYTCTSSPSGWTEPQALDGVNSDRDDLGPAPSPDGQSLYFYSDREGGLGGYDLWLARRGPDGWRTPINLGPTVNSPFNDYGPAVAPDGQSLYFASNRPKSGDAPPTADGWSATLREDFTHRDYDLYLTFIRDGGFDRASPLAQLNTAYNEGAPAVSPFGDFLYFSSDRPDGQGGFDLYRVRRVGNELRQVENLGGAVNTRFNELDPAMSLGGYALYFSSNRPGPSAESPPRYRLFTTTSREVFVESETRSARIDWASLWAQVGPSFLWGLLALLLLVLLLAILRDARRRKLSLLTRCLIGSIAAHLLVMFLLNFWRVTTGVVQGVRHGGRIQVAFSGRATEGGLTSQIRGALTDVSMPAPLYATPTRLSGPPRVQSNVVTMQLPIEQSEIHADDRPSIIPSIADAAPRMPRGSPRAASPPPPASTQLLDVALPADATRVAQQEPDSSLAAPAPIDPVVGRIHRVVATSQPAGEQTTVSLQPHSEARDDALTAAKPISTALIADSAPRLAVALPLPTAVALVAIPLGVTLPVAPEGAPAPSTEHHESVTALPIMAGRAEHAASDSAGFAQASMREIGPQPSNPQPSDSPVTTGISLATDARSIMVSTGDAPVQPPIATDSPRVLDVRLPASENRIGAGSADGSGDISIAKPPIGVAVAMPGVERRATVAARSAGDASSATGTGLSTFELAPSIEGANHGTGNAGTSPGNSGSGTRDADVPVASLSAAGTDGHDRALAPGAIELNPRLPTEILTPASPYIQRQSDTKLDVAKRMGGSEKTEQAVERALNWLARHQSKDGRWSGSEFDNDCRQCGGQTDIQGDVALTGLSLLCFLGAGHTHGKDGPYRATVQRGIHWLLAQQTDNGDLRDEETMYSHGIASIALSEAYGMTHDQRLADPVRRTVRFIRSAKSAAGGWRYSPGEPGDTSVLGWQVMALKSASLAGIAVPETLLDFARKWFDLVSRPGSPGRYAYQPGRRASRPMTAESMFALQLLGARRDEPRMGASVAYIMQELPDWSDKPNTYYWYYATLALYQHQGPEWKRWNSALLEQLLPHQRSKGAAKGSWNPVGEWSKTGGRIYQTALCTLMLEVYYRYLPLYSVEQPSTDQTRP